MNITAHNRRPALTLLSTAALAMGLALTGCATDEPVAAGTPDPQVSVEVDAAAAAALPAKYKDAGAINVAADIPNPPMEMLDENNNPTGLDYDLSQAMGGKLGVKFNFQQQAFDTSIPSLQAGKNDIIFAGMNDTAERQKVLNFVDYFHAGFKILVNAGNPEGIGSIIDLCGKPVAVQKATVQVDYLVSYASKCEEAGKAPIELVQLPTELDAQTAVRSGKAVADVVDASVAAYAAATAGDGKLFELVKDPEFPNGYNPVYTGIGLLKENQELTEALHLALQSLVEDGTYLKLMEKYDLADFAVTEAGVNNGGK
ncbi:ABC transporter substrate-binding protein [Paeniglutamicibacter sp.]|uniref:ABC transporter substrate-binding protein n=1 Tax=Paeniglutamicibacter sp. TaxID=1934391 RepID=UPI00398972F7